MAGRRKGRKRGAMNPRRAAAMRTVAIFASKMNERRSLSQKTADVLTQSFGNMWFLGTNVFFFLFWILVNTGVVPIFPIIDPFPFFLLTTFVSLEAILLAIVVLVSENRAARVAELREEIDFQVNVQAEREITKMLTMLDEIRAALKIRPKNDAELEEMKRTIDVERLGGEIEEELG